MDLYRSLRLSIYLLVASGAFAIWDVDNNIRYLALVLLSATVAHFTVDSGGWRPLRTGFAGAFCLALLLHYLVPALDWISRHEPRMAAVHMSHYLIVVQIVLFFTAFRGSAVFTFCGSSLFVVVVSGILSSSPSLLARMVFYLGATTWTLFLHSLWRERARFLDLEFASTDKADRELNQDREPSDRTRLSDKTLLQGLQMSALVTLVCMAFGFTLFFCWPRVSSDFLGSLQDWIAPGSFEEAQEDPVNPVRGGHAGAKIDNINTRDSVTGMGQTVSLDNLEGRIRPDSRPALEVRFDREARQVVNSDGRVFMRGLAFYKYVNNAWRTTQERNKRSASAGTKHIRISRNDPYYLAPPDDTDVIRQTILYRTPMGPVFFALAPVRGIELTDVVADEEGILFDPFGRILQPDTEDGRVVIESSLPVDFAALPEGTEAELRNQRYLSWEEAFPDSYHRVSVKSRTHKVVGTARSDDQIALRIMQYFRDPKRYSYTLDLTRDRLSSNPVADFILGDATQRRGHCALFATACVMMCRAAGLPARLATGFAHTVSQEEMGKKEIVFRNEEAHAWVEVFFSGYGWVTIDPTPIAEEGLAGTTPEALVDASANRKTPATVFPHQDPGFFREMWGYFLKYDSREQEDLYGAMGGKVTTIFSKCIDALSGFGFGGILSVAIIWILLAAGLVYIGLSLFRVSENQKGRVAQMPPRAKAAVRFYNDLLSVLSKRGFVRRAGQTPREFAETVVRRGGALFAPVMEVTYIFERVRYGGEEIGQDELEEVESVFRTLSENAHSGDDKTERRED